jgi:hypothetical protein
MSLKVANPLFYPVSMLAGGVVLVVGARGLNITAPVIIPIALAVSALGASALKSREPDLEEIARQKLEAELQSLTIAGQTVAAKAEGLRLEAAQRLGELADLEILTSVQFACDRAAEIPFKITQLSQRVNRDQSLVLSMDNLQAQLQTARSRQQVSSGLARQQFDQLVQSLERNIQLAQDGQSTSAAQIASIQTFVQNSAGLLQEFQNELRLTDLDNPQHLQKLKRLSENLSNVCDDANHLIA